MTRSLKYYIQTSVRKTNKTNDNEHNIPKLWYNQEIEPRIHGIEGGTEVYTKGKQNLFSEIMAENSPGLKKQASKHMRYLETQDRHGQRMCPWHTLVKCQKHTVKKHYETHEGKMPCTPHLCVYVCVGHETRKVIYLKREGRCWGEVKMRGKGILMWQ